MVNTFHTGPRSKEHFPDLGILLAASLISDAGITPDLICAIIEEAIVRNVVWALNKHPELAYLEPEKMSSHRLLTTFEAGRTSYRLLMFLKLFSSTAGVPDQSLAQLCDTLFEQHGAPPLGVSATMAKESRDIQEVKYFSEFLQKMGIQGKYTREGFGAMLRASIAKSVEVGYSTMPVNQSMLYLVRRDMDGEVGRSSEVHIGWNEQAWYGNGVFPRLNFFPKRGGGGGHT